MAERPPSGAIVRVPVALDSLQSLPAPSDVACDEGGSADEPWPEASAAGGDDDLDWSAHALTQPYEEASPPLEAPPSPGCASAASAAASPVAAAASPAVGAVDGAAAAAAAAVAVCAPFPGRCPFAVGDVVRVAARTGANENRPGGVARVTRAAAAAAGGGWALDVSYVLGGRERALPSRFAEPYAIGDDRKKRTILGRCKIFGCGSLTIDCGHPPGQEKGAKVANFKPLLSRSFSTRFG